MVLWGTGSTALWYGVDLWSASNRSCGGFSDFDHVICGSNSKQYRSLSYSTTVSHFCKRPCKNEGRRIWKQVNTLGLSREPRSWKGCLCSSIKVSASWFITLFLCSWVAMDHLKDFPGNFSIRMKPTPTGLPGCSSSKSKTFGAGTAVCARKRRVATSLWII